METANPVYLRIGYHESIDSKKQVLSSEVSLLHTIKIARRYYALKEIEKDLKTKLQREVKELSILIRKTKAVFPFIKIPQRAKREELQKHEPVSKEKFDEDLEAELVAIQKKLKMMEA